MVQHAPPDQSRVYQEVSALGAELKKLEPVAGSLVKSRVAIILDWEAWWALELPSKPAAFSYIDSAVQFHRYFYDKNIAVDFVPPSADLSPYAVVVAPNLYLLAKKDGLNLEGYVRRGGNLIVTYFSGIVDESETIGSGGYPAYLRKTLGLWIEEWFPLGTDETRTIKFAGKKPIRGRLWSEVIHLEGARALAKYTECHLSGRPAVTENRLEKGRAYYIGTQLAEPDLTDFLDILGKQAGLKPVLKVPKGVEVTLREKGTERFLFVMNRTQKQVKINLTDKTGTDLLSGRHLKNRLLLPGFGVVVCRLESSH